MSPKQYLDLKAILKKMEINCKKMPILAINKAAEKKETIGKNDIRIISKNSEINLLDKYNWTQTISTKMKILTYAGKKTVF